MADPTPGRPALLGRRRFARRQWARRWLALRYVVAATLALGLVVGGVWLVWFSSFLGVAGVDVTGTEDLDAAQVREVVAVPAGEPLARVDLAAVEARVEAMAYVRSAEVTRRWPDRLVVAVEEREAIAVVDIAGRVRGMDLDGVLFREYQRPPADLPTVRTSTETGSEALREAARVVAALPDGVSRLVDHVEVATVDQISLALRDGREVVWGSAEGSDEKAAVLAALLRQPGRVLDVSVPGQPTTSG
jgi:cell division protein FtsQ